MLIRTTTKLVTLGVLGAVCAYLWWLLWMSILRGCDDTADAGTGTGTESGTGTGTGSNPTGTGTGSDAGSGTGTGSDAGSGTSTGSDAGSGSGTGTGSDAGNGSGTGTGTGTGSVDAPLVVDVTPTVALVNEVTPSTYTFTFEVPPDMKNPFLVRVYLQQWDGLPVHSLSLDAPDAYVTVDPPLDGPYAATVSSDGESTLIESTSNLVLNLPESSVYTFLFTPLTSGTRTVTMVTLSIADA